MKNIKKIFGAVLILLVLAIPMSMIDTASKRHSTTTSTTVTTEEKQELSSFVEYGNGVYYFQRTGKNFANALAGFLTIHTNLEVTAMTGNVVHQNGRRIGSASDYGAAVGYFVTFREKK